jgi:putative oxidoreductase
VEIMGKWFLWVMRIIPALILLQSTWFKFSAAPEAVELFNALGMEPNGRILIGILELIAAVMLIIPRTVASGALLSFGLMIGAVIAHLTVVGVVVNNDGGLLFGMALIVLVLSGIVMYNYRNQLPILGKTM